MTAKDFFELIEQMSRIRKTISRYLTQKQRVGKASGR